MYNAPNAVDACVYKPIPFLLNKLNNMLEQLDGILRELEVYLETKRQLFPRYYIIAVTKISIFVLSHRIKISFADFILYLTMIFWKFWLIQTVLT